jgi:hypothetical protein
MHYYNPSLPLTPAWIPFPSTGNAIVISSAYPSSSYEGDMTDVGDSQGDRWTRTPFTIANDDPQIYYTCLGSEEGSRDLTLDWLPDTGTTHMVVYDIAGAKMTGGPTGCVGATVDSQTGKQASSANASILNAPVITPDASHSLVIAVNMLGLGPPSGTLTSGVIFTSTWATGMTDATNWDSGDCYGYIYTTSTNPISFNWQMANANTLPNGGSAYDGAAIEILPATEAMQDAETLTVANSPVVYNGRPQAATVTGSVPGTVSDVLYNGSSAVPTAAGTYAITANFTPQNTTEYSTLTGESAGNFIINSATPTVTLSSSMNPSGVGKSVTFTATVSSTATGTVTFYDGATALGTGALSGGSVTLSTSALPAGSNSITAAYGGDSNDNARTSGAMIQTVTQAIGTCTNPNPNPNPNPTSFATPSDFNGDCKSDILFRNSNTAQFETWFINGTAISGQGSLGNVGSPWSVQGIGDFNGDGKADILWQNSSTGQLEIWFMNGTTALSHGFPGTVPAPWTIRSVGDFNGDGKADILWQNTSTGQVEIWIMNGAAISSTGGLGNVLPPWNIVDVGDFNGDGKADILWQNSSTGQVEIWLMNGTAALSHGIPGSVPAPWTIHAVGDFNGDGKTDILWQNSSTGQVEIWLMNGTVLSSTGNLGSVFPPWSIAGVGDFNGDGKADILWRNSSTGQVEIWLMNGATALTHGSPGAPDSTWQIVGLE